MLEANVAPASAHGGSPSIHEPDYWWYRARGDLLRTVLKRFADPQADVLDVGSADGPSVGWLRGSPRHVSLDLDPRGLTHGGVCGSLLALPFARSSFDVVAAFDVIEHCEPEQDAVGEITRVLRPGGVLLMSVPAYNWAWTAFDDENGHHRRYTRARAVRAVEAAGLEVLRSTHIFAGTFPFFAAQRLLTRMREHHGARHEAADVVDLPHVSAPVERLLLTLCRADQRWLARHDLPFGSSAVVAARKPVSEVGTPPSDPPGT